MNNPEIVFTIERSIECVVAADAVQILVPVLDVYIDGKLFNDHDSIPLSNHVSLNYYGKLYPLREYGLALISILHASLAKTAAFTCHQFVGALLDKKLPPRHKNEGWFVSDSPFPGNVVNLSPFTGVQLRKGNNNIHSAFHISDGLFLWKGGVSARYTVTTLEQMAQIYTFDALYVINLESNCDGCKKSFSPDALKSCSSCHQATYCGRECQKKHWPLHKQRCKFTTNPLLLADYADEHFFQRHEAEIMGLCKHMEINPQVIHWFRDILSVCNATAIPCTRLEELNALDSSGNTELVVLGIANQCNRDYPFCVAELRFTIMTYVIKLSEAKMLGFCFNHDVKWTQITRYPIPSDRSDAFCSKTYQIPLFLHCGFTKHTGHFVTQGQDYKFVWNK